MKALSAINFLALASSVATAAYASVPPPPPPPPLELPEGGRTTTITTPLTTSDCIVMLEGPTSPPNCSFVYEEEIYDVTVSIPPDYTVTVRRCDISIESEQTGTVHQFIRCEKRFGSVLDLNALQAFRAQCEAIADEYVIQYEREYCPPPGSIEVNEGEIIP